MIYKSVDGKIIRMPLLLSSLQDYIKNHKCCLGLHMLKVKKWFIFLRGKMESKVIERKKMVN